MNQDLHQPLPAWEVDLNESFFPYLRDHRVDGHLIAPGALYVEAGLALHKNLFPQHGCVLEQLEFHQFLLAESKEGQILHLSFQPQTQRYALHSRLRQEGAAWTLHASGKLLPVKAAELAPLDLAAIQARCRNEMGVDTFYARLKQSKLDYGPYFQTFNRLLAGSQEALGRIEGHETLGDDSGGYWVHPTILDAGFQLCALTLDSTEARPWVPASVERITLYESPGRMCWAYSRILARTEETLRANMFILDDRGHIAVEVKNVCLQAVKLGETSRDLLKRGLYEFQWRPIEGVEENNLERNHEQWLIFGNSGQTVNVLREHLKGQHIRYTQIVCGSEYRKYDENHYCVRPGEREDLRRMFVDLQETAFQAIVYLWSLAEDPDQLIFDFENAVRHCSAIAWGGDFRHGRQRGETGISAFPGGKPGDGFAHLTLCR